MTKVSIKDILVSGRISIYRGANTACNSKQNFRTPILLRQTKNMKPNLGRSLMLDVTIEITSPRKMLEKTMIQIP